uniref:Phosphatidylinositol transfer protein n=1 Tax=Globodera rostochiensis TaxID=31243 RepID=A0A914HFJ0_GLORO
MFTKEYRIIMPMTVEEFQIGHLWTVAEAAKKETGGGEGVQVLRNEPFEGANLFHGEFTSGQYTHKVYHVDTKMPAILRAFMPKGSQTLHERAWNAYPYILTKFTSPYMKENLELTIQTIYQDNAGTTENPFGLPPDELSRRMVVNIDIANDKEHLSRSDIREATRPSMFRSEVTGRGPLRGAWQENTDPLMCCYKLITVNFNLFGFQTLVESYLKKQFPRLLSKFHREMFCMMDRWYGLTLAQIRALEEETQRQLDQLRATGKPRGMLG